MARKKFSELVARMSPEAQVEIKERTAALMREMPLQALRQARTLSQATLAQALGATQPQVSKIEHRTDLYVSTLRRYVRALGGELDILATFPEGSVRIDLFRNIDPLVASVWSGVEAHKAEVQVSADVVIAPGHIRPGHRDYVQIKHYPLAPLPAQTRQRKTLSSDEAVQIVGTPEPVAA